MASKGKLIPGTVEHIWNSDLRDWVDYHYIPEGYILLDKEGFEKACLKAIDMFDKGDDLDISIGYEGALGLLDKYSREVGK